MPQRLRLPAALAVALIVAEAAVLLLRPKQKYPVAPAEPRDYFSAEELERATSFRNGQLVVFGARAAVELAVLAGATRVAPRHSVASGAASGAALTLATTAAGLPLRALARRRAKDVGLITQSWGGWAADLAKGAAIGGGLSAAGGALLSVGLQRLGSRWWLPGAATVAGVSVVFTYLGPVVLDPVFNRFTPLPAGAARDDVLDLAARAGVDVGEVYEVDASRRTTAANAYVTGLGRTKRVVLYDTLLTDFTPAETRLVVAHELAHVRHHDVGHGLLWLALVAPSATLAVAVAAAALTRPGRSPVPAVVLAGALIAPVLTTVANQLSRAIERRADAFALSLTGEPDAMVAFERRITLQNLSDPAPSRWLALLATHPPTIERIGQALATRATTTRR